MPATTGDFPALGAADSRAAGHPAEDQQGDRGDGDVADQGTQAGGQGAAPAGQGDARHQKCLRGAGLDGRGEAEAGAEEEEFMHE